MYRLFWKFFLSFWVALGLFAGAVIVAASHYLDEMRERGNAVNPYVQLARDMRAAQAAADTGGIEGLKTWARKVDRREAVPVLVLDTDGQDILGRPISARMLERFNRRADRFSAPLEHRPNRMRPAIRLADGGEYWLFPDFQGVTLGRILHRPRVIAAPLLLAALTAALVCFLLARYLVAPIERLRRATEAYAGGDLNQRVGPSLGGRRDEIADLAHAFDRMAERLNDLMQSHKQLLTDVSHELRSPLARVQAALGLARQHAGSRVDPEFDRIDREIERLSAMIGQLLSLARLESGLQPPPMEPVDLTDMLKAVAADAALEAQALKRSVRLEMMESPVMVHGNPPLLHSAIENVVRNAIRYTADGTEVALRMARAPARPDWVQIEIRDHGPGVPDVMLPRMFEPFVRVGDDRGRASGGYGLGLAIADRAVRLHGGEISAHNGIPDGLRVVIRLPMARNS